MSKSLAATLCHILALATLPAAVVAQPVTGSGAEFFWSAPKEGALLDVSAGQEKPVSLQSPRRLPAQGWLVATLHPNEVAWVHLDGDPEGRSVQFAFLSGGAGGAAALEAAPERHGNGDFVFTAPLAAGPMNRLALSVRANQPAPRAQIWVGSVKSPGFRWELWEQQAKKWAAHPEKQPPSPPDLAGEPLVERLTLIRDALALAQSESGQTNADAVSALLKGEALLANLPVREPFFPYFRRKELTSNLANSRKVQKLEDQKMMEVVDAQPLTFTLNGPSMLRIEARTQFDNSPQHRSTPLQLVLSSEGRMVGLAAEDVLPVEPKDQKEARNPKEQAAEENRLSSRRRIVIATAPGRHTYELKVHGGPAWVSVLTHTRTLHAEQLASHSEDIPRLLDQARSLSRSNGADGAFALLVDGETSYLSLDDAHARERFQLLLNKARAPQLRAFAMLRLAALAKGGESRQDALAPALALLGDAQDEAAVRLRNMLIAEHLTRVLAKTEPGTAPSKDAVELLLAHPDALTFMPAFAGPLLRYVPGPRSLALPLLAAAQRRVPLDPVLRHYLTREWFTGSRWAALAALEMTGAQSVDLLAPPAQLTTCDEAGRQGARAYAPLSEKDAELDVPVSLAPESSLHRFHLVTLHPGAPRVNWAVVTLDGERSRLPLLLARERLPFALGAGHHRMRATSPGAKAGSLLGPCALLQQPSDIALLMEHRFSALSGPGAHVRVEVPGAGTPGFLGVELRPAAALRGGRLLLRTEQGVIGHINIEGHTADAQVVGMNIGPAVMLELPLPAATRSLDIVREDSGEQLLVRTLLRRSLATPEAVAPATPVLERGNPVLLEHLRQATRARRAAKDPAAEAQAQLKRAEILSMLQAIALSRMDAERALPKLMDPAAMARTHTLLATLNEPSLVLVPPGGPAAALLAPGAGLEASAQEEACVARALVRFAEKPAAGRAAAARCPGVLGRYAAARLEEQDGNAEAAARHYEAAYLASVAAGAPRPGLAREAALRYAERGPGAGSQDALALATAAAQAGDLDGPRAIERVRGLSHPRAVRGVDEGEAQRVEEGEIAPLTLRAALADVPWEPGKFIEVRAGKSAQTGFDAKQPIRLRIDLLCDDEGEPAAVAVTPPCNLRVEVDGVPVGEGRIHQLRGGEQLRLADVSLGSGPHRIQVALARRHAVPGPSDGALAFVHLSSDRPLHGAAARPDTQGYFTVPIAPPPLQRFIATPDQRVQLRVQGPTVLRMDALAQRGSGERAITAELVRDGGAPIRRTYPICTQPTSQQPPILQPGFDCRSVVMMPLVDPGTYRIQLRAAGTPRMAMALSVFEDEATQGYEGPAPAAGAALVAEASGDIEQPANPALRSIVRPDSNWLRGLGTLQVQTLGVISTGGGASDDRYAETAVYYRRKLDDLPIWLKGGALLHLRDGPASFGLEGRIFARIPVIQLRLSAEMQGFTQAVDATQAYALGFHTYMERSFEVVPHLYILPRFAFTANYQSLESRPIESASTGAGGDAQDGAAVSAAATSVDASVFNKFDAAHRTAIYGQLMVWWVPFINMIVYGQGRLTSNQSVHQLDSVRGRFGFDLAIRTTEFVSYYEIAHFLADDARANSVLRHRIGAEIGQTIWLNRNHRLGLLLSANVEATTRETTWIFGAFWEGSRSRGLDDYSTPEINLPQQLGQGRGYLRPEETLR